MRGCTLTDHGPLMDSHINVAKAQAFLCIANLACRVRPRAIGLSRIYLVRAIL